MSRPGPAYFISDIHLGAGYIADPRAHEALVVKWLDEVVLPEAGSLYLLGDVLDFWWEYRTVVPRGFVRFFGALARVADAGVEVVWLKGNHDIWINDYLPGEIGLEVADGIVRRTILGKRFLLEHGDGVGRLPRSFRMLRRLFRNRAAQALFASVHPRWTIGLAHGWSSHSRRKGGYLGDAGSDDATVLRPLEAFAREDAAAHPGETDYYVFGHVHRTADMPLPGGARMIVLGDWITRFTYGRFDGETFKIERFQGRI